jgi:predicted dehydrogenase
MRFGVIGAGQWGRNIIRTLRGMPAAELTCVASRNPATRDLVGGGCAVEPDWRALLRRPHLDAVVVAAPPALHVEMTAGAVSSGLPVFVEKPLACGVREAEQLLELAAGKGGYVLVDHVHLFSHAYRTLKKRLPDIGRITRISTEAGAWGPFRRDAPVLWDWGPHDAAFCVDLLDMRSSAVRAKRLERRAIDGAVGETLALYADHPSGTTVEIRLSNLLRAKRRRLSVEGPAGSLHYDDCAEQKLTVTRVAPAAGGVETIHLPDTPPLECALSQFVANVASGRTTLDDLRFGVDVVRMLDRWQAVMQ